MPRFTIKERAYDLPRNIALLDTNVLVALADPDDDLHETAEIALEASDYIWIAPHSSVVEAWNLLVGRDRKIVQADFMIDWIRTPGNAIPLVDEFEPFETVSGAARKFRIDIVDCALMRLASHITASGDYAPAVHVATFDVRDFLRCFGKVGLKYNVFNMRDLTSTAA